MPRKFGPGTWRYVNVKIGTATLKYVFRSKLKDSLKTEFGQTDVSAQFNVANAVLSPNRPKPARASKRFPTGYEGSFCSTDKISALKLNGYTVTKPKLALIGPGGFSRVLYVTINGVNYAWRRPKNAGGEVALTELGVKDADGSELDLVFGADFPKPAQAIRTITSQGTYRSFVDNSKVQNGQLDQAAADAGWAVTELAQTSQAALLALTISG
ncbi:hypothetical protein FEK30_13265 [Picosynechococcus sp. PCC 11901]|uniref:hypothetical protein n=1 Tax=Picosynechococcus sp. PCC 11901 TaxID=2579791 RepID=UPI0010FC337C|nr:hypothetical protein [Picosynechococcus sp. PCC 11901]QCS50312.1 hypothetical protein FEK30_13265 [Picosynechococcus sp. PCC 11901]